MSSIHFIQQQQKKNIDLISKAADWNQVRLQSRVDQRKMYDDPSAYFFIQFCILEKFFLEKYIDVNSDIQGFFFRCYLQSGYSFEIQTIIKIYSDIMGCVQSKKQFSSSLMQPAKRIWKSKCPLNHQLRNINMTQVSKRYYHNQVGWMHNYYPSNCQVCVNGCQFFLRCQLCKYCICMKHLAHSEFCPDPKINCYLIQGQCMVCLQQKFNNSGFKCQTCSFICCTSCLNLKHCEIEGPKQYYFQKRSLNRNWKCFNCPGKTNGGFSCSKCKACFCSECQQYQLNKYNGVPEDKLNSDQCSICLIKLAKKPTIKLDCTHQFHGQCINSWKTRTCPYCRSPF